ncbi:MAG: hypothetical protein GC160_22905 [Acidobacteria bacterium]|nr:hypothetical protein [Acidobacteriota bacterium]
MRPIRHLLRNNRGNAFVELALTLPVLTLMLFGVITGGLVFDRYMTVVQLCRNAAGMMARGANFALATNKQLLLTGQNLEITANGGNGVIYLTRVTVAPPGTANEGEIVIAERHVIGNPNFRPSVLGSPASAIWPNPDKPAPTGDVKDFNEEPSAVANVPAALSTLPLGESMYVAEIYHSAESIRFGRAWRDPLQMSSVTYF